MEDIIVRIDAEAPARKLRGPYKKRDNRRHAALRTQLQSSGKLVLGSPLPMGRGVPDSLLLVQGWSKAEFYPQADHLLSD